MPAIKGSANSFTEDTPKAYKAATMTKVVIEVKILLESVWVILSFTIVSKDSPFPIVCIFSRIRSKITMVALMEYPTIVSIHAIKVVPTDTFTMA